MCPLRRATFAQWVTFGTRVSLVRHATVARRDIFLPLLLSFCHATVAWWVVLVLEVTSSLRGQHFSWGRWDFMMCLVSCHCCATGHLPVYWCFPCHFRTVYCPFASNGQFLGGSTLFQCRGFQFLAAALRGQFSVLTPFLLRFSNRHYFGVLLGDLSFFCHLRFPVH
jgi:hypothetical protein